MLISPAVELKLFGQFIAAISLFHFVYSWYKSCFKQGIKLDYWHFTLLVTLVFPSFVLYPFTWSWRNHHYVGWHFLYFRDYIPEAFFVTACGYWAIQLGAIITPWVEQMHKVNQWGAEAIICMGKSRLMVVFSVLCVMAAWAVASVIFYHEGLNFNLRYYALGSYQELRPIFNLLYVSLIPMLAALMLYRAIDQRSLFIFVLAGVLFLTLIISGQRVGLLFPAALLIVFCCIRYPALPYSRLLMGGGLLGGVMVGWEGLREGGSPLASLTRFADRIIYGNNFSDLRDFAWILSKWDGALWHGKTYVAALMAFIPRSLSPFRQEWSLSVVTNQIIDFPQIHAGMRPGLFGESFMNFGLLGVVLFGLLYGGVLRAVDNDIRQVAQKPQGAFAAMYASSFMAMVASCCLITANAWFAWILLAIVVGYKIFRTLYNGVAQKIIKSSKKNLTSSRKLAVGDVTVRKAA
ncbi:MAG: oligosaccharide repeat unit polymerase [Alphaproteobacteria bacterium]